MSLRITQPRTRFKAVSSLLSLWIVRSSSGRGRSASSVSFGVRVVGRCWILSPVCISFLLGRLNCLYFPFLPPFLQHQNVGNENGGEKERERD